MELGIGGLGQATEIGAGASAVVYRARQLDLDREVAVKVLSVTDEAFVRRFRREAKTLGKLSQNPGIVTVYDTGVTAAGQPYLILELCQSSVLDHLNGAGPFTPIDACRAGAQVADAVADAHENGVVHRDLKPGNVLLSQTGRYMVTDFGISTVTGATHGQTNSVGFTAGYVAPETLTGEQAGPPADVYALGATLFHMITGKAPFVDPEQNSNLLALAQRVVNDPIPDLRPDGVPDAVCQVIEATMAKDPADRPTALELRDRLLTVAGMPAPQPGAALGEAPRPAPPVVGGGEVHLMTEAMNDSPGADLTAVTPPAAGTGQPPGGFGSVPVESGSQSPGNGPSILVHEPQAPLPGGPTPEERRYLYTEDDRRQLGPLLLGAVVGLLALVAVAAFLLNRGGDGEEVAGDGTSIEIADGPSTSTDGSGNESTDQGDGGGQGTLEPSDSVPTTVDEEDLTVTVPDVTGDGEALATSALEALGLVVNRLSQQSSTVDRGDVISQDPQGGTEVEEGATVTIVVSDTVIQPTRVIPTTLPSDPVEARAALVALGLNVLDDVVENDETVPKGEVIDTSPAKGSTVTLGSDVTLRVSDGPVPKCPAVIGLTEAAATTQLTDAGLTVTTATEPSETVTAGEVISCTETATTARIVISSGVADPCPALIGIDKDAAITSLTDANFTVTDTGARYAAADNAVYSCEIIGRAVTLLWSTGARTACAVLAGQTVGDATRALQDEGFTVSSSVEFSDTVAKDDVISCSITAFTADLVVSDGPEPLPTVPDVAGRTVAEATTAIEAANLVVSGTTPIDSALPAGEVIRTNPVAGTEVAVGSNVRLIVSNGSQAPVPVPTVIGSARGVAATAIRAANLVVAVTLQELPAGDPRIGEVIAVSPNEGVLVAPQSTVTITVGAAPDDP